MPPNHKTDDDDEEDDYMSMIIEEPTQQRETLTQRKLRKQRESEAKARIPSKAERAAAEATRRENALAASVLDPSNKGFKMMAKLGFKAGDTLGKKKTDEAIPSGEKEGSKGEGQVTPAASAVAADISTLTATTNAATSSSTAATAATDWIQSRAEPLRLVVKEDRGGIGLDSEKKRKFREDTEHVAKKSKAEEGEYRDRMRAEREERRLEAQVHGAQKVAEKLDVEEEEHKQDEQKDGEDKKTEKKAKPIEQVNVLYRGLVRQRAEKERERLVRQAFENSFTATATSTSFFPKPRLPSYNAEDGEETSHEKHALESEQENIAFVEQDVDVLAEDAEDPELDEFNALPASERLSQLVEYMREKYWYCFWCKYRYDSGEMDGCPGTTEEDHD